MAKRIVLIAYVCFFFMYFIGFGLLAYIKYHKPYPWHNLVTPLSISSFITTVATVLLAHFVVFKKYYHARPRWKLALAVPAILGFYILFRYGLEEMLYPAFIGVRNYYPSTTFWFYVMDNIYFGSIIIFIGFVFFLLDELLINQKKQAALKELNRQAELNFLQAQMNPHFLFNSLNNIYSLARDNHKNTAEAVYILSDIMRYVTYEKGKKVTLQKEIAHIENMIAIQQLRHDYKLNVQYMVADDALRCNIVPLLLISLVENALKHGDLSDSSNPLTINIKKLDDKLHICVSNKTGEQANYGADSGVGLKNLFRRLELTYPQGQYSCNTDKDNERYMVNLIIPIIK